MLGFIGTKIPPSVTTAVSAPSLPKPADQVCCHEFVIGELACGQLRQRSEILYYLSNLPQATTARHEDAVELIEQRRLYRAGLGWIDVHLLASAVIDGLRVWTADGTLATTATKLGVASSPERS